ncbi:uncharacterized protein LOC125949543 isoform X1 [Anopheles darlingi]|uniref:uncharacterized protein LOC125949543 isoform X1 n=1 Tax=Anopheles darlingi TaxID=43151 RepID=UPI0021003332|nr:uncharacterized protein LOC125949543 isoform X1 [Anopheles darlingi]
MSSGKATTAPTEQPATVDDLQMPSPARSDSPLSPRPAGGGGIPPVANFSVINYVGKSQKQSAVCRLSGRSRTAPYGKSSPRPCVISGPEPQIDETTSSSSTSSSSEFSCGSSTSISNNGSTVSNSNSSSSSCSGANIHCSTSSEPSDPMDSIDSMEDGSSSSMVGHRVRSRRSMSVSSSGCSSSMDDRNCDFSPLGSIVSCQCNSYSMSDFDDDGFREDSSVSTAYAVMSASRSYQSHHPLHHNHQNVPHHPNNHKGLFDIALKTVRLIRRNQELQLRLSQLQEETNAFIESVMANPENETLRSQFYGPQSKQRITAPLTVQK